MTECSKCGAKYKDQKTCESIYYEFMALEFSDPGYGRVHFLTVACYMVQHGGYSDEMYGWIQSAMKKYLEDGYTTEMIRQDAAEGPGRTKRIRRTTDALSLPKVAWSMTIADVALQMNDADSYCKLIEEWGRATLKEMGPLVLRNEIT